MKKSFLSFLSLFTSAGTLICCALPALFVSLGMGAAFAGLVSKFPQLIWLSEHKQWIFIVGAVALLIAGCAQWNARNQPCPIDPVQAKACRITRKWSLAVYIASVGIYAIGTAFAALG